MMYNQNCCNKGLIQTMETIEIKDAKEEKTQWYLNKEENAAKRFNVCEQCDQLTSIASMCKQCGCFMKIKTRIYGSSCPLQKW